MVAKELEKYFVIPSDNRDLNYNKYFFEGKVRITKTIIHLTQIDYQKIV